MEQLATLKRQLQSAGNQEESPFKQYSGITNENLVLSPSYKQSVRRVDTREAEAVYARSLSPKERMDQLKLSYGIKLSPGEKEDQQRAYFKQPLNIQTQYTEEQRLQAEENAVLRLKYSD